MSVTRILPAVYKWFKKRVYSSGRRHETLDVYGWTGVIEHLWLYLTGESQSSGDKLINAHSHAHARTPYDWKRHIIFWRQKKKLHKTCRQLNDATLQNYFLDRFQITGLLINLRRIEQKQNKRLLDNHINRSSESWTHGSNKLYTFVDAVHLWRGRPLVRNQIVKSLQKVITKMKQVIEKKLVQLLQL